MGLLVCGCMGCPAVLCICIQRGWHSCGTDCLGQPGTYTPHTATCLTHSPCLGEISGDLCAFSTLGLSVLLCNSEQPFQPNTAVVEVWATVGQADPVPQLSTAVPNACKRQTLSGCLSRGGVQLPEAYSFCQLFFPFWVLTFCCCLTS